MTASRGVGKRIQQKIKLPPLGIKLKTDHGLEVRCLSNCANLSCLASLRLSESYKVMFY